MYGKNLRATEYPALPSLHLIVIPSHTFCPSEENQLVAALDPVRWNVWFDLYSKPFLSNKFKIHSIKVDSNSYPIIGGNYLCFTCSIAVAYTMSNGFCASTIEITSHFTLIGNLSVVMATIVILYDVVGSIFVWTIRRTTIYIIIFVSIMIFSR